MHTRDSLPPCSIRLSEWRDSLTRCRIWLIRRKVVPLSEKPYHFWKSRTTFRQLWLSHAQDSHTRTRDSHICARELKNSDKNRKNPFALIETTSLTVCLHASPCERAHSVSLQPHRQSPRGFNQRNSKNRKNSLSDMMGKIWLMSLLPNG